MEQFNIVAIPTGIAMATFWWISVYLFTRNPSSEKIRALSLAFFLMSSYLLLGVLQTNLKVVDTVYVNVQRIMIWAIAFPAPAWFYFSTTSLSKKNKEKQKPLVIAAFIYGLVLAMLGAFTTLLYDYSQINITKDPSIYLVAGGKLFWLLSVQVISLTVLAVRNFFMTAEEKIETTKKAFYIVTMGAVFFALAGIFLTLNVLFGNVYPETTGEVLLLIGLVIITYSIIRYSSRFETGVLLFGKEFVLSTAVLLGLYAVFGAVIFLIGFEYSFKLLLLIVAGILLIPVTHIGYDWVMSFVRNVFYQRKLAIPKVTDGEVSSALRNVNRPVALEESGLMRLTLLDRLAAKEDTDRIETLRKLIKEAVDFLKPDETSHRIRSNLKYQLLKLIYDQVEEGQILWDLGFEEYPLEIAEKGEGKKPRFAISYPTDYQATSRNAFINLKKEAIHDLAWRISYLEKHVK